LEEQETTGLAGLSGAGGEYGKEGEGGEGDTGAAATVGWGSGGMGVARGAGLLARFGGWRSLGVGEAI